MSKPAFLIARELANNSRSGLTPRFLSKKLGMPEEEIEYLLDVNHKLMFTDLTKIKLVAEGYNAVKRIGGGLENRGDVPSLFQQIKTLSPHDYRRLAEQIGIDEDISKKQLTEEFLGRYYKNPDSIVTYVATRGFSNRARELFDILWNAPGGIMPVSKLRAAHGGNEFDLEQALWELFRGMAAFELFRFDAEDRLVRMAALLSEIRHERTGNEGNGQQKNKLKAFRGAPEPVSRHGLSFSENLCRIVAAIAARPVRLRGDGELFREDRRRLADICPDETEPALDTCLCVAEGAGWLVRVDDFLHAPVLDTLIGLDRLDRHRILFDWLTSQGDEAVARTIMANLAHELRTDAWYPALEFIRHAAQSNTEQDQPVLKPMGAHWAYVSPSASGQSERSIARALEETFFWLGLVDRAMDGNETLLQLTPLGKALFLGERPDELAAYYPPRQAEFIVQPNFDIVVPAQDMDPLLTVPLDQFATRASSGLATVYNLNKESFTLAVQEGHSPAAFVEFLLQHNRGGALPSNVMTTLEDWRGGMKRIRLKTYHVVEADDPLVMADLMHRRKFRKFFAPVDARLVVRYDDIPRAELEKELEKDGFIVE